MTYYSGASTATCDYTIDDTITSNAISYDDFVQKYLYTPATQETLYDINSYLRTIPTITATCYTATYDYCRTGINIQPTNDDIYSWPVRDCTYNLRPLTNRDILQTKIKSNLVIQIKSRVPDQQAVAENELIALDTLREVVTESEFRKYLKYGFVLVKGQSGDIYQIFKNRSHTKVWRNGELIEEVCVRLKGEVPATDNVIAFKAMIEADESSFKKCGNVFKMKAA
jgi:hypothetical protein